MRLIILLSIAVLASSVACKRTPAEPPVPRDPDQAVADTSKSAGQSRENLWKNHGCDLIKDADLERMLEVNIKNDVLNSRTLPDQAFCLRTWNKPDWKERENNNEKKGAKWFDPQNSLVVQVFGYYTNEHARLQLEMLKRDRRNTYEEDVTGLGDGALWSTGTVTLLVRKGHMVLSIALNHKDNPHDNLAKARELAEFALTKM